MPAADTDIVESEAERVERWRTSELMRVGFPGDDAIVLGARFDVDLHDAIALVQRGCPVDLAIRILS
jgi:hypothetical protein